MVLQPVALVPNRPILRKAGRQAEQNADADYFTWP